MDSDKSGGGFYTILIVVFIAGIAAWFKFGPAGEPDSATFRYRVTFSVMVDDLLVEGSSVAERTIRFGGFDAPAVGAIAAEAVAVDLGKRGYLFALQVDPSDNDGWYKGPPVSALYSLVPDLQRKPEGIPRVQEVVKLPEGARADLPLTKLPMLVRFRDPLDSTSGEIVDPEHLDAAFGPGVRLAGVRVERTNEPVTWKLDTILPWIKQDFPLVTKVNIHIRGVPTTTSLSPTKFIAPDSTWGRR